MTGPSVLVYEPIQSQPTSNNSKCICLAGAYSGNTLRFCNQSSESTDCFSITKYLVCLSTSAVLFVRVTSTLAPCKTVVRCCLPRSVNCQGSSLRDGAETQVATRSQCNCCHLRISNLILVHILFSLELLLASATPPSIPI